jgi:hypothetical protein
MIVARSTTEQMPALVKYNDGQSYNKTDTGSQSYISPRRRVGAKLAPSPFKKKPPRRTTWGRCYDHNFLRFLPIFGEKIGVFLKNQYYDHNFC